MSSRMGLNVEINRRSPVSDTPGTQHLIVQGVVRSGPIGTSGREVAVYIPRQVIERIMRLQQTEELPVIDAESNEG